LFEPFWSLGPDEDLVYKEPETFFALYYRVMHA
jgi:hypothetical protein